MLWKLCPKHEVLNAFLGKIWKRKFWGFFGSDYVRTHNCWMDLFLNKVIFSFPEWMATVCSSWWGALIICTQARSSAVNNELKVPSERALNDFLTCGRLIAIRENPIYFLKAHLMKTKIQADCSSENWKTFTNDHGSRWVLFAGRQENAFLRNQDFVVALQKM